MHDQEYDECPPTRLSANDNKPVFSIQTEITHLIKIIARHAASEYLSQGTNIANAANDNSSQNRKSSK